MQIFHGSSLRHGRYSCSEQAYLVTAITRNREPLFSDMAAARIAIRTLRQLESSGAATSIAFVVMPDHLHWLFTLRGTPLPDVVRRLKGKTARELNRFRLAYGPVWQAGYQDHAVRAEEDLLAIARYIVANPVRAGLVKSVRDYPHWDAAWIPEQSS